MAQAALHVVLGNQLFPPATLPEDARGLPVFMAEDLGLCTYTRHHKQKIALFLAAMRSYADELRQRGVTVHYEKLDAQHGPELQAKYETKLKRFLDGRGVRELVIHEIEDKFFERRIEAFAEEHNLKLRILESPMFLTPRKVFADYLEEADGKPFMAAFYKQQRRRLGVLMTKQGEPKGGKWSYDDENRKKLPMSVEAPKTDWAAPTDHVRDVIALVNERFADHPGELSEDGWWLPTTRRQALAWLRAFLDERFKLFGDYEDALSTRDPFLFHSVLSPTMNLGLITPREILDRALEHAEQGDIPLNSLEGFVRQIIGWREFIRGIYRHDSEEQDQANHFNHHRKLTEHWYRGDTGLPPLDDVIQKALRFGWAHHIERLMVAGNLMTLCEIEPRAAYDWFMNLFVDSSDWVMGPNVFGMGLFSDGGLFATKPYICGSNYLLKMSDYGKGEWCDVMDGLYWRFIHQHRDDFARNPRLSMMVRALDKLDDERRQRIFGAAGAFLKKVTR
jgi:deoxyribodipyrimidine photolyase-related protein